MLHRGLAIGYGDRIWYSQHVAPLDSHQFWQSCIELSSLNSKASELHLSHSISCPHFDPDIDIDAYFKSNLIGCKCKAKMKMIKLVIKITWLDGCRG